jgi:hypothetical protein
MSRLRDRSVKNSIQRQLRSDKDLNLQIRVLIEKQFKTAHKKLLNDFSEHSITRELKVGAGAPNYSGGLAEGNLFGFIGFEVGYDPIKPIERLLIKANILIKQRKVMRSGFTWAYAVNMPSIEDLYKITPMPWASGSSWLRELEGRGIPNLGQYMYVDAKSSRSTEGIQGGSRPGGRLRMDYIKPLLEEFENNLNNISGAQRISARNF